MRTVGFFKVYKRKTQRCGKYYTPLPSSFSRVKVNDQSEQEKPYPYTMVITKQLAEKGTG